MKLDKTHMTMGKLGQVRTELIEKIDKKLCEMLNEGVRIVVTDKKETVKMKSLFPSLFKTEPLQYDELIIRMESTKSVWIKLSFYSNKVFQESIREKVAEIIANQFIKKILNGDCTCGCYLDEAIEYVVDLWDKSIVEEEKVIKTIYKILKKSKYLS